MKATKKDAKIKGFRKRFVSLILFAVLFTAMLPTAVFAGSTERVTLSVGETKPLYASEAYRDGQWTSSNRAVSIVSQNRSSCTIRVEEYTSARTVIHCFYTKAVSNGRYMYYQQDYKDFEIVVKKPSYVTVTFDANEGWIGNGQRTLSKEYISGGTYEDLPIPWRSGYRFAGWYTKSAGGSKISSSSKVGKSAVTLYAQWREISYTVKFDGNGADTGSMSSLRCNGGESYTLPACGFRRDGWRFSGWNLRKDGSGSRYTDGASFSDLTSTDGGTVTLYAQWEKLQESRSLESAEIHFTGNTPVYTGSALYPELTVRLDGTLLREGTDYTVSYSRNINAGTGLATIVGTGSYTGTTEKEFTIQKAQQGMTANTASFTLKTGETADIAVRAEGSLSYQSSRPGIASVDRQGRITAVSEGSAEITVTADETGNYKPASLVIAVTVKAPYSPPTPTPTPTPQPRKDEPDNPRIELTFSQSSVVLDLNSSATQELLLTASGADLPEEYTFRYQRNGRCFSCRWTGDWQGDSHPVSLYGLREGSGSITFYLVDSDTGSILATTEVDVTIVSGSPSESGGHSAQLFVSKDHVELDFLYHYYEVVTITAIDDESARSSSLMVESSNYSIDAFWYSNWNGNSVDLAIYGGRSGAQGTITVSIIDDDTGEILASKEISVTVV